MYVCSPQHIYTVVQVDLSCNKIVALEHEIEHSNVIVSCCTTLLSRRLDYDMSYSYSKMHVSFGADCFMKCPITLRVVQMEPSVTRRDSFGLRSLAPAR